MRTLVQISDLHFGRADPALVEPLLLAVRAAHPDLVIVAGDLTQRAESKQFREARELLSLLPKPLLVLPGNHDVPLHNLFLRFFNPLGKYRRFISEELEPLYCDEQILVITINTARSLTVAGGRISMSQINRAEKLLRDAGRMRVKVVVTHHPFDLPSEIGEKHLVGRAQAAMKALTDAGADLFMAGHLHLWHADLTTHRYSTVNRTAVIVQSGTGFSTRTRGEVNSINVIHLDADSISVEQLAWSVSRSDFRCVASKTFVRSEGGWKAEP